MPLFISKKGIKEMGLEYDYPEREKACASQPLKVKLDKKHVGEIRKVKDGYQYYPKGEKKGGEVFPKVSEVQNSLLCTQPRKKDTQKPVDDNEDSEVLVEALRKARKKIDRLEAVAGTADMLLGATVDLLDKQTDSKDVLNLLEQVVTYDDIDCDGHSLHDDIKNHLGA
jgi:hypothetical protein